MEFRPIGLQELEQLVPMMLALYQDDPEEAGVNRDKAIRTLEHLTFRPDKGEIIVFVDGSKYCGYAIILFLWSNEYGGDLVVVDEIYVKPQFRSQGLGKSFFAWLETRYQGARGIVLETTPANERARALYIGLGFREAENIRLLKPLGG